MPGVDRVEIVLCVVAADLVKRRFCLFVLLLPRRRVLVDRDHMPEALGQVAGDGMMCDERVFPLAHEYAVALGCDLIEVGAIVRDRGPGLQESGDDLRGLVSAAV